MRRAERNPNWKDAGKHNCLQCGSLFKNYNKSSKYCSQSCAAKANHPPELMREIAKLPRKPRLKLGRLLICKVCSQEFRAATKRIYCDQHAALGRMNQGRGQGHHYSKKDANHDSAVGWFTSRGATVLELHAVGSGFPDLIVGYAAKNHLVEIKNPKNSYGRRGLSENQKAFADTWCTPVNVVRTEEDAAALIACWAAVAALIGKEAMA